MLLFSLPDADGSRCTLTFEEAHGWLRATWRGYVDPLEAMRGAEQYLEQIGGLRCPYLLNDNTELQGPWFDSVEWLQQAWLPQARRLGLRFVAHVVPASQRADLLTLRFPQGIDEPLQVQLFEHVAEAEQWLHRCQREQAAAAGANSPGPG